MLAQCKILAVVGALILSALVCTALVARPKVASGDNEDTCGPKESFYWEGPDCTKFIKCKFGNVTFHTCQQGKFWNHEKAKCDAKKNVPGCKEDGSYLVDLTAGSTQGSKPAEMNGAAAESEHEEPLGESGHESAAEDAETVIRRRPRPRLPTRRPFIRGGGRGPNNPTGGLGAQGAGRNPANGAGGNQQEDNNEHQDGGSAHEEQGSNESAEKQDEATGGAGGETQANS